SYIRDTDMATESTKFTKNQLMVQAGTSMLAQANQLPQSALSLIA
ncbi:MAG: flagellin, partial [Planctomycetota bacterium]|nr:flagellin [Planctomycetota bacterium]